MSWPKIDVILNAIKNSSAQTITDLKPTIDGIKTNFGETADTGGGVNEGTAMAKLNKLLSKMPLYENYDIRRTQNVGVQDGVLTFLNVSGGGVLIGYSLYFNAVTPKSNDGVTVKIYADDVLMYNIGHPTHLADSNVNTRLDVFSSFDDNFLFNLYASAYVPLFSYKNIITPSENHVTAIDVDVAPPILVKPPISQNSLIVEAFKNTKATGNIGLTILYGVKK